MPTGRVITPNSYTTLASTLQTRRWGPDKEGTPSVLHFVLSSALGV